MGSGRGDRNQQGEMLTASDVCALQWGPVVVTGISTELVVLTVPARALQWGPVVVTGIS